MVLPPKPLHPKGEPSELSRQVATATLEMDTFEGKIQVEWEPGTSVTPMGQLAFFIQFLKTGCRFEPWVAVTGPVEESSKMTSNHNLP